MPQLPSKPLDFYSITDGLNTLKSGVRIGPSELKTAINIRYRPLGGFGWRLGYETLGNEPGVPCTGLYMTRFDAGTNVAFRAQGAMLEKMDALDGTWDDITGALVLTAGRDNTWTFATLNDIVIGVNKVDDAVQINSSLSASTVGALPGSAVPLFVYEHRGYMFYITTNAAFFSDLNTPATVQTNNFIRPGGKTGGSLVGGVDYQGKNFIFKRHAIHAVEFQPTRVNSAGDLFPFVEIPNPIVPNVGTQSARSIAKFTTPITHKTPGQELVFFVDQFGLPRLLDGDTTIVIGTAISDSRDDTIVSLAHTNKSRLAHVWAVNDAANSRIYCFMNGAGSSEHTQCWVLDYTTSFAWSRDSYADNFNCGAIFEDANGVFKPYFANYVGQVMEMDSTQTDNGAAIMSKARTGDVYVESPVVRSKWLYNEVRGTAGDDSQEIGVNYYKDGEDTPSATSSLVLFKEGEPKWDEVNWDEFNWSYAGLTTKSSEINLEAKTLSVEFFNETEGNSAKIEGFSLFVIPEGWKQED